MELRLAYPKSAEEWEPYRGLITRLYRDENRSLKEVQQLLESRYKFKATEKMYKGRIKAWGLDKKHKHHEVVEILRLQAERGRDGKESTFVLRGREVNINDVNRYVRRKKISLQEQDPPQPSGIANQVPDLVCRTPSPSLSVVPAVSALDETEKFYLAFQQYLLGSVETGYWNPSAQSPDLQNSLSSCGGWVDILTTISIGAARFHDGRYQQAVWHWRIAFTQLEIAVSSWNYYQLLNLISGVTELANCDTVAATMFLHHLDKLVTPIAGSSSPQKSVLRSLTNLDPTTFKHLLLFTRRCCLPVFDSHFSNLHPDFVLFWEAALAQLESKSGVWTFSPLLLARTVARMHAADQNTVVLLYAVERVVDALHTSQHHLEAEYLCQLRVERLQNLTQTRFVSGQMFRARIDLGRIKYSLGKREEARRNFLLAISLYEQMKLQWGESVDDRQSWKDRFMKDLLQSLIDLELTMGLSVEASEHKIQLEDLISANDEQVLKQLADNDLL